MDALKELDKQEVIEFSKKLKDFKSDVKGSIGVLKQMLELDLNMEDLKNYKIGITLKKINDEGWQDDEGKDLKKAAKELYDQAKKRAPTNESAKKPQVVQEKKEE